MSDTERLDWVEEHSEGIQYDNILGWRVFPGLWRNTMREAIDAAMELDKPND